MAQEIQTGLCINLEGWDREGDGREVQKGGDICIRVADSWLRSDRKQQKFCKVIILQLKNKFKIKKHGSSELG